MLMFWKMDPLTEAEQKLVEENMGIVRFCVNRWLRMTSNNHIKGRSSKKCIQHDFDDLFQCGMIGLMRCVKTWDPEKGKLSTYCERNIFRCIQSWVIGDKNIKPSEYKALVSASIKRKMDADPSLTYASPEIRKLYHNYKPETIRNMVESETYIFTKSLDEPHDHVFDEDGTDSEYNMIPDDDPNQLDKLEEKQKISNLYTLVDSLPLKKKTHETKTPRNIKSIVLKECYLNERTLEDVGKEYNVSRERIRQLKEEALNDLRRMMT